MAALMALPFVALPLLGAAVLLAAGAIDPGVSAGIILGSWVVLTALWRLDRTAWLPLVVAAPWGALVAAVVVGSST